MKNTTAKCICLALAAGTLSASAQLIKNGDMSLNAYAPGGNHATVADLDQGWAVKSQNNLDFNTNPGKITWDGPTASLLEDALAQVNTVAPESGSLLTLSFDWTPAAGATSTNTSLDYQLVGWITNGTAAPVATDIFFNNINGNSMKVSSLSDKADVVDLLTGINLGTGTPTPTAGTVAGTAGITSHASITIDLSLYAAGLTDVTNFDFIGVRFSIHGDQSDLSAIGSTLDNVQLSTSNTTWSADAESNFFTDTISLVSSTVDLVGDYGASGSDTNDDSAALQSAIDAMTLLPGGGKITMPAGRFYLKSIQLKSNVHLVIAPDAKLILAGSSGSMFYLGLSSGGADALTTISNVSIRCSAPGRYTVDVSHVAPNPTKAQFVKCWNVYNFLVADFHILDHLTKISGITLNTADYNGQWFQPRYGVIKNGDILNGHYGYGLIQAQACNNILFKNLTGTGGITLRLETGAVPYAAPAEIKLDQIYGRNIAVTNGHGAAMMGPHYRNNGHVDLDGISAVASLYAASAGAGFVNSQEAAAGYTPGSFANTSIIRNVHAVYGEMAELKWKNFDDIPCPLQHLISSGPIYSGIIYRGPSSTAANDNSPDVTFSNVTFEGFAYRTNAITSAADAVSSCPLVPVTGLTLSTNILLLPVAASAELTATVSPTNATDPSVIWRSDNPAVAEISANGTVTAIAAGTAALTATTLDGGLAATCTATVSGGGGGSWSVLLNDDFETGWGNWQSDWANWAGNVSDAVLTNANAIGTQCVDLKGKTTSSVMSLSAPLDLTAYDNLKIGFSYQAENFAGLQDFWVQFSGNDGVTWQMIDDAVVTKDFVNGVRTNASFIISRKHYPFSAQSRLRIGNNKSGGGEHLFVDQIVVSAFRPSGWGDFVSTFGLNAVSTNDTDADSVNDLTEYALGGNPTNPADTGQAPRFEYGTNDMVTFAHWQVALTNPGIAYQAEWTDNLVSNHWKSSWDTASSSPSANPDYTVEEQQLYGGTNAHLFFRLRVSQP